MNPILRFIGLIAKKKKKPLCFHALEHETPCKNQSEFRKEIQMCGGEEELGYQPDRISFLLLEAWAKSADAVTAAMKGRSRNLIK